MFKALVHIYADAKLEPEPKSPNTPVYRRPSAEESKKAQRTGLVFETTVTGETVEEVTRKAVTMLEMNLKAEQDSEAIRAVIAQGPTRNRGEH